MMDDKHDRPSLKTFDAYADRDGQDIEPDSSLDVGTPSRTQDQLKRNPAGDAEAARIASGTPRQDAVDATEAETPPKNLRRLGDPSNRSRAADEAIERATAVVGEDEA